MIGPCSRWQRLAGYATGNDFTPRDLQSGRGGQWMVDKAIDGFAPIGPYLVTADQVDPDNLTIECRVNGETRQSSTTADFIFNTRQMVSDISDYFTLKPGDELACSIEGLGELA